MYLMRRTALTGSKTAINIDTLRRHYCMARGGVNGGRVERAKGPLAHG